MYLQFSTKVELVLDNGDDKWNQVDVNPFIIYLLVKCTWLFEPPISMFTLESMSSASAKVA